MKLSKLLSLLILLLTASAVRAQGIRQEIAANPDKASGIYHVYTFDNPRLTPAPKGYKPFYISHYGRHGSRWLLYDSEYSEMKELFDKAAAAGALTAKGVEVYERIKLVYDDGIDRAGSLTPLGETQHREIAERMYRSYPEIFAGEAEVDAQSTIIVRCILSMSAYCERLKELNPALRISRTANRRSTRHLEFFYESVNTIDRDYLEYLRNGDWNQEVARLLKERVDSRRMAALFFSDATYLETLDSPKLMKGLFSFAVNMQDVEAGVSFYYLFTTEELYWLSVCDNYRYYVMRGPSPLNRQFPRYYAKSLLEEMLARADRAIAGEGPAADLRFGHDLNLLALVPLMQFEEYAAEESDPEKIAEMWPVYKISPMAANLQMVFFRKKNSDDVLVKFLYNESEVHIPVASDVSPYYHWNDVRAFYRRTMDTLGMPTLKKDTQK